MLQNIEKRHIYKHGSIERGVLLILALCKQVIEDCLCRFKPDEICISFNGGKDCSALLHLVAAAWKKKEIKGKLRAIYIRGLDPFPEMEKFVEDSRQRFDKKINLFLTLVIMTINCKGTTWNCVPFLAPFVLDYKRSLISTLQSRPF